MIKLLWNTQNQIVPKPSDSKYKELSRNHIWGVYHKNNSEKWILEVLNKIKFKKITNENEIDNDNEKDIQSSKSKPKRKKRRGRRRKLKKKNHLFLKEI